MVPVHGLNDRLNFATTFACGAAVSLGLNDTFPLPTVHTTSPAAEDGLAPGRGRRRRDQESARHTGITPAPMRECTRLTPTCDARIC